MGAGLHCWSWFPKLYKRNILLETDILSVFFGGKRYTMGTLWDTLWNIFGALIWLFCEKWQKPCTSNENRMYKNMHLIGAFISHLYLFLYNLFSLAWFSFHFTCFHTSSLIYGSSPNFASNIYRIKED